jgi:hypothetical protein
MSKIITHQRIVRNIQTHPKEDTASNRASGLLNGFGWEIINYNEMLITF